MRSNIQWEMPNKYCPRVTDSIFQENSGDFMSIVLLEKQINSGPHRIAAVYYASPFEFLWWLPRKVSSRSRELCPVTERPLPCSASESDSFPHSREVKPEWSIGATAGTLSYCLSSQNELLGLLLCCVNSLLSPAGELVLRPADLTSTLELLRNILHPST